MSYESAPILGGGPPPREYYNMPPDIRRLSREQLATFTYRMALSDYYEYVSGYRERVQNELDKDPVLLTVFGSLTDLEDHFETYNNLSEADRTHYNSVEYLWWQIGPQLEALASTTEEGRGIPSWEELLRLGLTGADNYEKFDDAMRAMEDWEREAFSRWMNEGAFRHFERQSVHMSNDWNTADASLNANRLHWQDYWALSGAERAYYDVFVTEILAKRTRGEDIDIVGSQSRSAFRTKSVEDVLYDFWRHTGKESSTILFTYLVNLINIDNASAPDFGGLPAIHEVRALGAKLKRRLASDEASSGRPAERADGELDPREEKFREIYALRDTDPDKYQRRVNGLYGKDALRDEEWRAYNLWESRWDVTPPLVRALGREALHPSRRPRHVQDQLFY